MKKTLFILGATMIASTVFTSCSKEESSTPRNYYGVEPVNNGTPKEAYYAFFGGIMLIIFGILWLLKKMKAKK
jgi:hypothetical protein